jgi:hypothetical protein
MDRFVSHLSPSWAEEIGEILVLLVGVPLLLLTFAAQGLGWHLYGDRLRTEWNRVLGIWITVLPF